jgi:hypothetical protein
VRQLQTFWSLHQLTSLSLQRTIHVRKGLRRNHLDKARANADTYCAANNKTTVNKIYQQFPEKFDDSMTEEEREGLRYEMATTFYNQGDDEMVA